MGGSWVRVALHVRRILEPLLPRAARAQEAACVIRSQIQVDEPESAHDHSLVVREVRAAEVAIEIGGEQLSVTHRTETGQGHAVGQPSAADLAGQQEIAKVFTELGSAGDGYKPGSSSPLSPAALKKNGDLIRDDESRVLAEISHESVVLRILHAQESAAEFQVPPFGRDVAANESQQLGIVMGMAYHTADLAVHVLIGPVNSMRSGPPKATAYAPHHMPSAACPHPTRWKSPLSGRAPTGDPARRVFPRG